MPTRPQIELTREELERAEIPTNHVLVRLLYLSEGLKTKGGLIVGYNEDITYEGDNSAHPADVAEVYAQVVKTPQKLLFDPEDPKSMDWETDMELGIGDTVWFSPLESKNANEILCEGQIYRSIPYQDCFVAKRNIPTPDGRDFTIIIPLNGFVLCKQCFMPKLSPLDAISDTIVDKSRGIIAFVGNAPKRYLRDSYSHIEDLKAGDEVIFEPRAPLIPLERVKSLARFQGNELFWVVARRRIIFVNKQT